MSIMLNISYNDARVIRRVEEVCGKPFGLWQVLRMGGTGTARFTLLVGPSDIEAHLHRQEDRRSFSLELRTKGVLIRFRSFLETLCVPIDGKCLESWAIAPADGPEYRVLRLMVDGHGMWYFRLPAGQVPTIVGFLRRARESAPRSVMELQKHAKSSSPGHDRHGP